MYLQYSQHKEGNVYAVGDTAIFLLICHCQGEEELNGPPHAKQDEDDGYCQ